jgi:hypothetical protein
MITETTIDAIPGRKYSTKVMRDVDQFHKSDWAAAEVNIDGYTNITSAYSAYKQAIERMRVAVTPICRRGKLYLIRSGDTESAGE